MQLSDTQLVILSAAAQRDDGMALPLPEHLKGGAAQKVVASLISKSLIKEVDAMPGQQTWIRTADGDGKTLIITSIGLVAIGIEPQEEGVAAEAPTSETPAPAAHSATGADTGAAAGEADHEAATAGPAPRAPTGGKVPKVREGTKQAQLVAMLRTPEGAAIAEIVAATNWQAHTVRGAIAGALKKKLGLEVTSEKIDGRGRVYRLPAA
jgi:hypothetical protein